MSGQDRTQAPLTTTEPKFDLEAVKARYEERKFGVGHTERSLRFVAEQDLAATIAELEACYEEMHEDLVNAWHSSDNTPPPTYERWLATRRGT